VRQLHEAQARRGDAIKKLIKRALAEEKESEDVKRLKARAETLQDQLRAAKNDFDESSQKYRLEKSTLELETDPTNK
jgi:hypothetical protein